MLELQNSVSADRTHYLPFSASIRDRIEKIAGLTAATEKEFLSFGDQLQQLMKHAQEISDNTSRIASLMTGERATVVSAILEDLHINLSHSKLNLDQNSEKLTTLLGIFEDIPRQLNSLCRTVKFVEMTGFLVKVEDARINDLNSGFRTVADDLRSLGAKITLKEEELRRCSQLACRAINSSLKVIESNRLRHEQNTQLIMKKLISSLDRLSEKHKSTVRTLEELSNGYREISQNANQIIISLQFHDITRQRIEHVLDVLGELHNRLVNKAEPPSSAEIVDALRLQAVQLRAAIGDMEQAISQIKRSLKLLQLKSAQISQGALTITEYKSGDERTFLKTFHADLGSLAAAFDAYDQVTQKTAKAMEEVPASVGEMSVSANNIDRIGIEMQIVAMNASINAARLGESGASLGVLALRTQELARQTSIYIKMVSSTLKSVASSIEELTIRAVASGTIKSASLTAALKNMRETISETDRLIGEALLENQQLRLAFSQEIAGLATFNISARLSLQVNEVSDLLESHAARMMRESSDDSYDRLSNKNGLASAYTMQAEREIHRKHVERSGATAPLAATTSHCPCVSESEFGDNVELF